MIKALRLIVIAVILVAMGGIGYTQVDWSKVNLGGGGSVKTSTIKSTSTGSRVGGDKTITVQHKKPGIIMQIRMLFGYNPKDQARRDFAKLKAEQESAAARNKGVNSFTGRKESTASKSSSSGVKRQAGANRTLKSALGGN